jgi:hypothetical protein
LSTCWPLACAFPVGRQARGVFKDQLVEGLFPQSGLRTVLLSNRRVNRPIGPARFVDDSLEEGDGFEPSVPVAREPVYIAEGELRGDRRAAKKIWRGTDGSNPSPSSAESAANLKTTSTFRCRVALPSLDCAVSQRKRWEQVKRYQSSVLGRVRWAIPFLLVRSGYDARRSSILCGQTVRPACLLRAEMR